MTQWGVLWAHTSADDLQLVDGCFTSITDVTAYAGPVARTGGFAYRLGEAAQPGRPVVDTRPWAGRRAYPARGAASVRGDRPVVMKPRRGWPTPARAAQAQPSSSLQPPDPLTH